MEGLCGGFSGGGVSYTECERRAVKVSVTHELVRNLFCTFSVIFYLFLEQMRLCFFSGW
jgi:hypothetical protein